MNQAVSLFVMRHDGKVLGIARRDDDDDFGLVGGKVDDGEALSDAIIREAREEAGIVVVDPVPAFTSCVVGRTGTTYMNTTFIASWIVGTPTRQHNEPRLAWIVPSLLCCGSYSSYNRRLMSHLGVPHNFISDADRLTYASHIEDL